MLSFNHLGRLGYLGNQMFQYAAIKGIAEYNNIPYMIPERKEHQLFDGFKMESCTETFGFLGGLDKRDDRGTPVDCTIVKEADFCFDSALFHAPPESASLYGFFQSEKYFLHIRENILQDFEFHDDIVDQCAAQIQTYGDDTVSLHIRRKDYLKNAAYHHNLSLHWYDKACALFPNHQILVFSDDIEWCKDQSFFQQDHFHFIQSEDGKMKAKDGRWTSRNRDHWYDLCLQSMCTHNIIANSSYSWWAAYLNKNPDKKIISPDPATLWFGPKNQHLSTQDVIPDSWHILA